MLYKKLRLLLEGSEINEQNIPINDGNQILHQLRQILKFRSSKFIGSGNYGDAYDIGDGKVLKITKDQSEAKESLGLISKNLKHIAEIYNVFKVDSKSRKGLTYYAIILEKLDTSPIINKNFDDLISAYNEFKYIGFFDMLDDVSIYGKQPQFGVEEKQYFVKHPDLFRFLKDFIGLATEVKENGIESFDYINSNNLGFKKDGSLGFFDLGYGNDNKKTSTQPNNITIDEENIEVNVKDKCKLGGSATCNQGDINNFEFTDLSEDIAPEEAYTNDDSLQTVIDGKRDVAFVDLNQNSGFRRVQMARLGVIRVKQDRGTKEKQIVYRDLKKAKELKRIADEYDGYLPSHPSKIDADEVRKIGELLGYHKKSIDTFIQQKFGQEVMNEVDGGKMSVEEFYSKNRIDPDDLDYLGGGDFGSAYSIGDGRVLKSTTSKSEFRLANEIKGKNIPALDGFADIYVAEIVDDKMLIIMEELDTDSSIEDKYYELESYLSNEGLPIQYIDNLDIDELGLDDEMVDFINDISDINHSYRYLGVEASDIKPDNMGYDNNGKLKAFDVDDRSVENEATNRSGKSVDWIKSTG